MKNIITLFFTAYSFIAFSQSISLTTVDSIHLEEVTTSLNDVFDHKTEVKNEDFGASDITWKIDSIYYPSAWDLSLCDIVTCPSITDTTGTSTFNLAGKATGELKMGYTPNGVAGSSYVRVAIVADGSGDPATYMVYTAKITANINAIKGTSEGYGFSLYPNPASNKLNLTIKDYSQIEKIAIYNVIGKEVSNFKINENLKTIDLSTFNNGVYIVKIFDKNGQSFSQSFVKK